MYSGLVNKIEKSRWYAEERERLSLGRFTASFRGEHNTYAVSYDRGAWSCTCPFFAGNGTCSHTLATSRILRGMLAEAPEGD